MHRPPQSNRCLRQDGGRGQIFTLQAWTWRESALKFCPSAQFDFTLFSRCDTPLAAVEMNEAHIHKIAGELKVQPRQVTVTAKLFAESATVPFIARYRKEATGSLDEVAITSIRERLLNLAELDQRREVILKSPTDPSGLSSEAPPASHWANYRRSNHKSFSN
jgi:hypothetical protein